mmetsp:Transcript_9991/g.24851  ORF Transcript_9991/g.24851 Transcript_9991/m.24851 type:complete len:307 (-) Transcript_9991:86-1006(-)
MERRRALRSRCVAAQHRSSANPRARATTSVAATAAISTVVALIADAPRSPLSLAPGHGIVAPYEELLPAGGRVAAACVVAVVARAGHHAKVEGDASVRRGVRPCEVHQLVAMEAVQRAEAPLEWTRRCGTGARSRGRRAHLGLSVGVGVGVGVASGTVVFLELLRPSPSYHERRVAQPLDPERVCAVRGRERQPEVDLAGLVAVVRVAVAATGRAIARHHHAERRVRLEHELVARAVEGGGDVRRDHLADEGAVAEHELLERRHVPSAAGRAPPALAWRCATRRLDLVKPAKVHCRAAELRRHRLL